MPYFAACTGNMLLHGVRHVIIGHAQVNTYSSPRALVRKGDEDMFKYARANLCLRQYSPYAQIFHYKQFASQATYDRRYTVIYTE